MVYRVIGTMSGSSLDGLDIAFVELQETSGKWTYELKHAVCYPYTEELKQKLSNACDLSLVDYLLLNTEYGRYTGEMINRFIEEFNLHYQVQLVTSHGHTTYHIPARQTTAQLGCGATIAAVTGINVVSDLRAMDVALGGQGAPIVPIGEKLLLGNNLFFLNLGGIANLSMNLDDRYIAFDVCPANRVLNLLSKKRGAEYDDNGSLAASGNVNTNLLELLNDLEYYNLPYPKSLSNDFGTDVIMPLLQRARSKDNDDLRTYVEHICVQIARAAAALLEEYPTRNREMKLFVTGGGAKNKFLVQRLAELLLPLGITVEIPSDKLIDFKEAIVMALIGVLRWREEYNTLATVTGASRNSIGGAVWIGQEA